MYSACVCALVCVKVWVCRCAGVGARAHVCVVAAPDHGISSQHAVHVHLDLFACASSLLYMCVHHGTKVAQGAKMWVPVQASLLLPACCLATAGRASVLTVTRWHTPAVITARW